MSKDFTRLEVNITHENADMIRQLMKEYNVHATDVVGTALSMLGLVKKNFITDTGTIKFKGKDKDNTIYQYNFPLLDKRNNIF